MKGARHYEPCRQIPRRQEKRRTNRNYGPSHDPASAACGHGGQCTAMPGDRGDRLRAGVTSSVQPIDRPRNGNRNAVSFDRHSRPYMGDFGVARAQRKNPCNSRSEATGSGVFKRGGARIRTGGDGFAIRCLRPLGYAAERPSTKASSAVLASGPGVPHVVSPPCIRWADYRHPPSIGWRGAVAIPGLQNRVARPTAKSTNSAHSHKSRADSMSGSTRSRQCPGQF